MTGSEDAQPLDRDVEGSEDLDEDPGASTARTTSASSPMTNHPRGLSG